jgi:predicted dithiol-disulfide oxidoreductase (DUF899 family)
MHDTDADDRSALPPAVTPGEWQQARDALLVKEKRVDRMRFGLNVLDHTALGRQETWEDSPPAGWPPAYRWWWRLHDEYRSGDHTAAA